ncbi:MAG: glycosyl hydrolase family 95 catalytic domain-containing protein, partial [Planctomycetota bacterium]
MIGQATQEGQHKGVKFEVLLRIVPEGGTLTATEKGLRLENANAATLLIVAGTDYRRGDPRALCDEYMAGVAGKKYSALRRAHVAEHRRLFRRVELDLGATQAADMPTDERLAAIKKGIKDPALCSLYFQFGRYLLISSSRPGCMPANLQGLWNHHIKAP